jgi:hypothetical protein
MSELPSNRNFFSRGIVLAAQRLATRGVVGASMAASFLRTLLSTGLPVAMALGVTLAGPLALTQVPVSILTLTARNAHEQTTWIKANRSLISEPLRLNRATVGKRCGETGQPTGSSAAQARETGDVNDGFHEAEIAVKQISKGPIYWAFCKSSMKANVLRTMATASNYRRCGEGCGESLGTQKEVSNG